jgi:hypothetical protein
MVAGLFSEWWQVFNDDLGMMGGDLPRVKAG